MSDITTWFNSEDFLSDGRKVHWAGVENSRIRVEFPFVPNFKRESGFKNFVYRNLAPYISGYTGIRTKDTLESNSFSNLILALQHQHPLFVAKGYEFIQPILTATGIFPHHEEFIAEISSLKVEKKEILARVIELPDENNSRIGDENFIFLENIREHLHQSSLASTFSNSRKRNISKALKHNFNIRYYIEDCNSALPEEFHLQAQKLNRVTGLGSGNRVDDLANLDQSSFFQRGGKRIFTFLYDETDTLVSIVGYLTLNKSAQYLKNESTVNAKTQGLNALNIYFSFLLLSEFNVKYVELGYFSKNRGDAKADSINKFKEGFGGELYYLPNFKLKSVYGFD
jgi:hypothetical protein